MKRSALILFILNLAIGSHAYAEDAANTAVPTPVAAVAATETVAPTPAVPAQPPAAESAAPLLTDDNTNLDNLEFVSGEVGAMDEAAKTLTIKLYGETESTATDKTLQVSVDSATDITDGEQDRDFKSLTVGTEVDVEYDPATNKATYIFVY